MFLSDLRRIIVLFFWYVLKWYFWLTHIWKNDVNTLIKPFSQIFKNQSVMSFNLSVLFEFNFFMTSTTFFFIMTAEQCTNIKYVAPKMSLKSTKNKIEKNWLTKNRVLFSKNVVSFSSTLFYMFLISVDIWQFIQNMTFDFDLFDQTSQFFFIRGIRINRFLNFQNFCFVYNFLFAIIRVKVNFSIFFIL